MTRRPSKETVILERLNKFLFRRGERAHTVKPTLYIFIYPNASLTSPNALRTHERDYIYTYIRPIYETYHTLLVISEPILEILPPPSLVLV